MFPRDSGSPVGNPKSWWVKDVAMRTCLAMVAIILNGYATGFFLKHLSAVCKAWDPIHRADQR